MNFAFLQYSEEELRNLAEHDLSEYNWADISQYQDLSEKFIFEFQDKVDWSFISIYQNLSEKFIRELQDKINWLYLRYNKKIQVSDEFTIEFDEKLNYNNAWKINNKRHRILGPAFIDNDGEKKYFYRGNEVIVNSDKEYFEWLQYKDF